MRRERISRSPPRAGGGPGRKCVRVLQTAAIGAGRAVSRGSRRDAQSRRTDPAGESCPGLTFDKTLGRKNPGPFSFLAGCGKGKAAWSNAGKGSGGYRMDGEIQAAARPWWREPQLYCLILVVL